MMILCNGLSAMAESGLSLLQSFKILEEHKEKRALKYLARDIRDALQHGDTFSEACYKQRKLLTPYFIAMVSAGERNGTLAEMFKELDRYYTDIYGAQQRIKRTAIYPFMIIVSLKLLYGIAVPIGNAFVAGAGIPFFEIAGNFLFDLFCMALGLIPCIIGLHFVFKLVSMESILIWFWPVARPMRRMLMARFSMAMSLLCKTGMKLPTALIIAARVTGSPLIEKDMKGLANRIKNGETLGEVLSASTYFPREHQSSIALGEESGKLDESFAHVAKILYSEVIHAANMTISVLFAVWMVMVVLHSFGFGKMFILSMLSFLLPG